MINRLRILKEENRVLFSVSENGIYNITIRNSNGRLIFEKSYWNLESNIEYFILTTHEIDNPDLFITKSYPVVKSRIDYKENKLFIKCDGSHELKFKLYDHNNNQVLHQQQISFNSTEIWYSPPFKLLTVGHLILITENMFGDVVHTNHFNPDYVFCHIPKTGGTSIRKVLRLKQDHRVFDKSKSDKFSFAFVRNPYDRFLSAFFYLSNGGLGNSDYEDGKNYIGDSDIDSFIKYKLKNSLSQQHLRPQHEYIPNGVDFIGKVENMQQDFDRLCVILGIDSIELPYENKTKYNYQLTEDQKEIIYEIYKVDFDKFGYQR